MDLKTLQSIFTIGETIAVEFKRCGNGIEADTYETVCSFLNRFGGDIFMGVLNDGTVVGVPEKAAPDMVKNFIKVVSNPTLFAPTVYLVPETIEYEAKTIIHVHIPPSAEVHSYKKVIYDRVDDADVKVTATGALAQMYIRKQNVFTEKKIYPYAKMEDLRLDLLPKIRIMAQNHAGGKHLWTSMDDQELLKSAGLYGRDIATGEEGLNLAAIMLLGKDDVILNVAPAYVTDALVRKVNVDRYDDREVIKTNLIESYDRYITMDNLEPNPKNPIIASFFRNIGYADQLGSGVRNLFKYSKYYSGQAPEFIEGDVFRIIVPLDDEYSFDFNLLKDGKKSANKMPKSADKMPISADKMPVSTDTVVENSLSTQQKLIYQFVAENGQIASRQAETLLEVKQRRARIILGEMVDIGVLERQGSYKSTVYVLKEGR